MSKSIPGRIRQGTHKGPGVVPSAEILQSVVSVGEKLAANANNPDPSDTPEDQDMMAQTYMDDAWDMRVLFISMKDGNIKEAWNHMQNLDTAVRDQVPDEAWLFCENKKNWK